MCVVSVQVLDSALSTFVFLFLSLYPLSPPAAEVGVWSLWPSLAHSLPLVSPSLLQLQGGYGWTAFTSTHRGGFGLYRSVLLCVLLLCVYVQLDAVRLFLAPAPQIRCDQAVKKKKKGRGGSVFISGAGMMNWGGGGDKERWSGGRKVWRLLWKLVFGRSCGRADRLSGHYCQLWHLWTFDGGYELPGNGCLAAKSRK